MPELYTCISTTADICADPQEPSIISRRDSQLLYGEAFEGQRDKPAPPGWIYGASVHDQYHGFVRRDLLSPHGQAPAHCVAVALTHLYPAPDFKMRPLMPLSFQSCLCIDAGESEKGFVKTTQGWVFAAHLQGPGAAASPTPDDMATMFLSAPYLYGGRSSLGIDCSGLVQLWLMACGLPCPRDSDQQATIGAPVKDAGDLRAGDLVFFPGHVGIMINRLQVLNATARAMRTVIEPLSALERAYGPATTMRRVVQVF